MDTRISELAKFLRLNGKNVIDGKCKLSLTTSILCFLNNFDEISIPEKNIRIKEDIDFLLNFMKMTFHLKIIHGAYTLRGGVDLSKFTSLKIVELHKVPMHLIIGLNKLSSQIKVLICHRSICCLKEIFLNGNDDVMHRSNWSELKELNIANNYIDTFDNSLCMLPNVENFDTSFNSLTSIEIIQVLEKLVFLNASYNRLQTVIGLNKMTSLKTLKIRNNVLECLNGIENLVNLCELDLRYNCLSEHSKLEVLKNLQFLETLYLEGNPLFFHKKHKKLTIQYIHSFAMENGILLDGELLSNKQGRKTYSTNGVSSSVKDNSILSSDVSVRPKKNADITMVGRNTEIPTTSAESCDKLSPPICEDTYLNMDNESTIMNHKRKIKDSSPYCEIKDLLAKRRDELKESWLISEENSSALAVSQSIIKVPPNSPVYNSLLQTNLEPPHSKLETDQDSSTLLKIESINEYPTLSTQSTFCTLEANDISHKNTEFVAKIKSLKEDAPRLGEWIEEQNSLRLLSEPLMLSKYEEICEPSSYLNELGQKEIQLPPLDTTYHFPNQPLSETSSDSETDSLCDEDIFFAEKKGNEKFHSVIINLHKFMLVELDSLSTRKIASLDLRSLSAILDICQNENENWYSVTLSFDVLKANDQKRCYLFNEKESAESFLKKIRPYAEEKAIQDFSVDALKCLKCHSEFSKTAAQLKVIKAEYPFDAVESQAANSAVIDYKEEADACPNCGSTIVVQLDSQPYPESTESSVYKKSYSEKPFSSEEESSSVSSAVVMNEKKFSSSKRIPNSNSEQADEPSKQKRNILNIDESNQSLKIRSESEATVKPVLENLNFLHLMKEEALSQDIFLSLDHRYKLYLEECIFKADETFEGCLETDFVLLSKCKDFHGFIIVSTKRLFMLEKLEENMDACNESLKFIAPLESLSILSVLLGNQGFSVTVKPNNEVVLCLLNDADLCKYFVSFFADVMRKILQDFEVPKFNVNIENIMMLQVYEEVIDPFYQSIRSECEKPEILLYMYIWCKIKETTEGLQACIIVTAEYIFLASLQFQKLGKELDEQKFLCHNILEKHKVTDLTKVILYESLVKLELCFEDEDGNRFENWKITTKRKNSSIALINALKKPWETIFGTDLMLSCVH